MKFIHWMLKFIFPPLSEDEQKRINQIRECKLKYPSMKVVGCGRVTIDPKEIINSKEFQEQLKQASDLINK